jgi:DNA-binding CsgD family transcriptional regulator
MFGRDAEMAALEALFDRASQGEPSAVVIAGEAGAGKSRLLREFAARVDERAQIAVGRCVYLGAAPPAYGGILGVLRSLVERFGASTVWRAAGPGRSALLLLLPELIEAPDVGASPEPANAVSPDLAGATPERMREALVTLVETLAAQHPLVLMVEDLHWADEGTLALLSFLMHVVERARVLVVLTWRSDEGRRGDPVRRFLGEAERARVLERLTLDRLDARAVRAMASALTGTDDDAVLHRLEERAGGIPFFLEELARCADGPLPDTLRDLLLARYEQLTADAAAIIRVASASGAPLPHDVLAALTDMSDERLDEGVRECVRAGVLVVDGDRYVFRHALFREAVHDELLPGERARLHRAYAELLQARADADPRLDLHADLAYHWQHAHDRRRALIAAHAAMNAAKARYAYSTAARFGSLVLDLWDQVDDPAEACGVDRVTLLQRIASILRNAGEADRALAVVDLALADPELKDAALRARLLRDKGLYLVNLGRPGAVELFTEALESMDGRVDDEVLRATILNYLASRHMVGARTSEAIDAATAAWEHASRAGSQREMSVARNVRGGSRGHLGDIEGALADYAEAREHATDASSELRYRVNYSDLLMVLGRYREAIAVAMEGQELARAVGVERTSGSIMTQNTVEPLLELGEIDRAEELLARDLEYRTFPVFRAYTTKSRVLALAWRGEHEAAARLLQEHRTTLTTAAASERQVWYGLVTMRIAIAESAGDPSAALRAVLEMIDDDGPVTAHRARILLQAGAIVSALRRRGADVGDAARRIRSAWSAVPASLRGTRWPRMLEPLLSPDVDALRDAVAVADEGDGPAPFRVVTRLELARTLIETDRRAEANTPLREALAEAERLAHAPLLREARAFAAASGLRVDDTAHASESAALHDLTARERQVLDLLAEGLSNGQIAQRLFISTKTVSVHVSAILRKLGVATRTEAAVLATRGSARDEPASRGSLDDPAA